MWTKLQISAANVPPYAQIHLIPKSLDKGTQLDNPIFFSHHILYLRSN